MFTIDIQPCELIILCQGSCSLSLEWCKIRPTIKAARGLPANAAIWPYVATLPRGTRLIVSITCLAKLIIANIPLMSNRGTGK